MNLTNGTSDTPQNKDSGSKVCERTSNPNANYGSEKSEPNGLSPASEYLQVLAVGGGLPEWAWFGG